MIDFFLSMNTVCKILMIEVVLILFGGYIVAPAICLWKRRERIKTACQWWIYVYGMKLIKLCNKITDHMSRYYTEDPEECPDWADPEKFYKNRL